MKPDESGRLFNESIEQGITSLVERVHFTPCGDGGDLSVGHNHILYQCVACDDLRRAVRQTLAEAIL